jgi:hypothetical protein
MLLRNFMHFPELFEGPASTLFLSQRNELHIINQEGEEARVALPDFLSYLFNLTTHHAATLALTHRTERLKARLAALLSYHRHG